MADPNFFPRSKKLTLEQISKITKIAIPKSVDKNRVFLDVSPLLWKSEIFTDKV